MDTPFTALERFNKAAAPVDVHLTLRSGALVDGTAVGGDENGLLIAESATAEPRTIPTADIIALAVREPSHPRMMLMFIAMVVAWFALLQAILRGFKIPVIERLLHPRREIYREP